MNKFSSFCALILSFISLSALDQHVTVIIPSYNNVDYYEKNLASVLEQEECSAIYIDDCSLDGTSDAVPAYLAAHDHEQRVTYIRNPVRKGAMANHWFAAHLCDPDDIIIHLDGDDFFTHANVVKRIKKEYADGSTLATYGQYREWPSGSLGHCRALMAHEANALRGIGLPLPISHLRTFKAHLFHNIPLKEFIVQGIFYPSAADAAFFIPVLEQAKGHIKFIPEVLYEYNTATPINDYKVRLQETLYCFSHIKQRAPFKPYNSSITRASISNTPDLIIYSYNRPMQLYALLESIERNLHNYGKITIIYKADSEPDKEYELFRKRLGSYALCRRNPRACDLKQLGLQAINTAPNPYHLLAVDDIFIMKEINNAKPNYEKGYDIVKKRFGAYTFWRQNPHAENFKQLTLQAINATSNQYCLFAMDDNVVVEEIDLAPCIAMLEKTKAYGFYLRLGKNITYSYNSKKNQTPPHLINLEDGIYAWQFNSQQFNDWHYPNSLDMTIFKKEMIMKALQEMKYDNPSNLEGNWYNHAYLDFSQIGLCFETSKIVNIPLNVVQKKIGNPHMNIAPKKLLEHFLNGDRLRYALSKNMINSPHMECSFSFHR